MGVYDDLSNGISGTLTSQIWTRSGNTGTLVPGTTMTFTTADPGTLVDAVRLKPLPTPVILQPGTYTFSSNGHSAADMNLNSNAGGFLRYADNGYGPVTSGPATAPGLITIVGQKRFGATAGTFPANADGDWLYGSGTFAFEQADPTAYTVLAGTVGTQNFDGSLGMDFNTNRPIKITHLGVFDSNSDGLNGTITARLYARASNNTAGVELATLSFTGSDGVLIGGTRFLPLSTPLVLPGGFEGTIVAEGYNASELNGNAGGPTPTQWFTFDGGGALSFVGTGRWGTAGLFPTNADGGPANRYAAGSFMFADAAPLGPGKLTTIPVPNGSFELPAYGPGGCCSPALSANGWTSSTGSYFDAGNYHPTAAQFPGGVPDGQQVAFMNTGSLISDPLAETLQPDTLYIMEVDWGHRLDSPNPQHSMNLRAGGVPLGWVNNGNIFNGPTPAPGDFATARGYFTANHNAPIGSSLDILLSKGGTGQTIYDNVRLSKITGAAVLLNNPSFELDDVAAGGGWQEGATGWVAGGGGGGVFEDAAQMAPADGLQTAFVRGGGSLTQTLLGVPLENDHRYILMVEVGNRASVPTAGYQVELLAGGTTIAMDNNSLGVPGAGLFYTTSVIDFLSYSDHPLAGQDLGIRLTALGTGANHTYFDNVRLFSVAVPEPSSLGLAFLGLVALAGYTRRKRRA
jgi:hypothetical protein